MRWRSWESVWDHVTVVDFDAKGKAKTVKCNHYDYGKAANHTRTLQILSPHLQLWEGGRFWLSHGETQKVPTTP